MKGYYLVALLLLLPVSVQAQNIEDLIRDGNTNLQQVISDDINATINTRFNQYEENLNIKADSYEKLADDKTQQFIIKITLANFFILFSAFFFANFVNRKFVKDPVLKQPKQPPLNAKIRPEDIPRRRQEIYDQFQQTKQEYDRLGEQYKQWQTQIKE